MDRGSLVVDVGVGCHRAGGPDSVMTEAEATQFADDIARAWTRSVREVKPTRCMWGGLMAVWSIRL